MKRALEVAAAGGHNLLLETEPAVLPLQRAQLLPLVGGQPVAAAALIQVGLLAPVPDRPR